MPDKNTKEQIIISSVRTMDDCLGGSSYLKITFSKPLGREQILSLSNHGDLEFHPDFMRPLFVFRSQKKFVIKGIENEDTCTLILPTKQRKEVIDFINNNLFVSAEQ